jgi:NADPH-dependent 2,4-dienoyl-CoA reductase/sulfur reductase-like enzyme
MLQAKPDYEFPFIRPAAYFDEQKIGLHLENAATSLDTKGKTVTLTNGDALPYDKLLLTMGARVRTLPIPGAELDGVFYLRTLDDSRGIDGALGAGNRLVVVGGGFIGLEVAASARARGTEVVVLELADRLMGRGVPKIVSERFLELHEANGVDVRLETGIERIEGDGTITGVVLPNGETLPADAVVIGVGVIPETELAAEAGIEVDNGIVVDELCRTSTTDVYAAGDVTNHRNPILGKSFRLEAWQCAQNMAIAAAKIMCGEDAPYAEIPWMWSDQYDANLQVAGMPDSWDDIVYRGDSSGDAFIGFIVDSGQVTGAIALNQARDMRLARRIMASGKSYEAGELADEGISMRDLAKR